YLRRHLIHHAALQCIRSQVSLLLLRNPCHYSRPCFHNSINGWLSDRALRGHSRGIEFETGFPSHSYPWFLRSLQGSTYSPHLLHCHWGIVLRPVDLQFVCKSTTFPDNQKHRFFIASDFR
ncbi:hypothetical protein PMAYCL1PPCAC_22927, partial [Pristionchus mayeri]